MFGRNRLLEFGDLRFLGLHLHLDRGREDQVVVGDARSLAIQVQRLRHVLLHAQACLVHVAEVDLGAVVALVGGLAEPLLRHPVIGIDAEALEVDLADVVHRFGIAGRRRFQPYLQRGLVVGAVEGDEFAAADLAVGLGRADRTARAHEGDLAAEPADLSRQQAVDDHEVFGVAHGLRVRHRDRHSRADGQPDCGD